MKTILDKVEVAIACLEKGNEFATRRALEELREVKELIRLKMAARSPELPDLREPGIYLQDGKIKLSNFGLGK